MSEKGAATQGSSPSPKGLSKSIWAFTFEKLGENMLEKYESWKKDFPNLDPFLTATFTAGGGMAAKSAYDHGFGRYRQEREEKIRKEEQEKRQQEQLKFFFEAQRNETKQGLLELKVDFNKQLSEMNTQIQVSKATMDLKSQKVDEKFQQKQPSTPSEFKQSSFFPHLPKVQQIKVARLVFNTLSKLFRK